MDQAIRNKLRGVVTLCRRLLEDSVSQELQGKFGIYAVRKDDVQVDDEARMSHLGDEERAARKDILDHLDHIKARGFKAREALDQLVREVAFTHLNRLCAYKMMEARQVYVGDQRFREAVSRGVNSNGVKFFLAEHPDDERLFTSGQQDVAYRHFLDWLGGLLSEEIGVLFSPHDSANRLYPPQRVLDEVLALINDEALADIWEQDETIGWVYQYFTPKELRDQARKESQAPRNSYELAFRNQFFTPRYVVEFLTDNTLGRIWYEMRKGDTKLKDQCRYMVRRPTEVFLADPLVAARHLGMSVESMGHIPPEVQAAFRGDFATAITEKDGINRSWIGLVVPLDQYQSATGHPFREGDDHPVVTEVWDALYEHPDGKLPVHPLKILVAMSQLVLTSSGGPYAARAEDQLWAALTATVEAQGDQSDLSQDELLKLPVCVPHRPKKDPRELKILDPACGSGHFLLYCFDLLLTIYLEAYADPDLGPALQRDYPTPDALRRDVPRLILAHNLHGIDIDLRASQIAALALWLRCQRAYQDMGLKRDRPKITRSNFVCAEPMPGEKSMLKEFVGQVEPKLLGQLVEVVFDKMKLAGEAGSLLKIEEEIRDAVAGARRQWLSGPVSIQRSLFDNDKPVAQQQRFDFSGITDAQFFEQAEAKVVEALRSYAEKAHNGQRLQRRLFAEDSVRGFAFVDLCHQRFDVALMNPPFGEPSKPAKQLIERQYPYTKHDLYAAFVEQGIKRLRRGGLLGAITSRTGLFLSSFQKWREEILLSGSQPTCFADLGNGVLDTAMVETAAYCVSSERFGGMIPFVNLLRTNDKDAGLKIALDGVKKHSLSPDVHIVSLDSFSQVAGSPFAYWVSESIRHLFSRLPSFTSESRYAAYTNPAGDDARYIRNHWEVPAEIIGRARRWVPIARGGRFSPFYSDVLQVVDWDEKSQSYRDFVGTSYRPMKRPASVQHFFKPGMTWPLRGVRYSAQALPSGCIFSVAGKFATSDNRAELLSLLGIMNSMVFDYLIGLFAGKVGGVQYEVGLIGKIPVPNSIQTKELDQVSQTAYQLAVSPSIFLETHHTFVVPRLLAVEGRSLAERLARHHQSLATNQLKLAECQRQLNDLVFAMYGISNSDRAVIENRLFALDGKADDDPDPDDEMGAAESQPTINREQAVRELISYFFGCAVGRWDVRYSTGVRPTPPLPQPFDPLPVCSPGMLRQSDGEALKQAPDDYPLPTTSDGILIDDVDHSADVVRRIRSLFDVLWSDQADAIEKESCEILGMKDLRDYVRKPGKGGFWDDHVSRYSKSRRKAPIYWLLQSSKKNYAVWLYYHRLDKDLLFKALVNYVVPKIRLEDSRLETLRTQKAAAGGSGRDAKRLGKEVERQEEFLSELRDFEDKLRRAANLHLEPDLNDGVVLNIAPLWELVPWKEAKNYWGELLEGKYEWSSIGKQLREKGLVQ